MYEYCKVGMTESKSFNAQLHQYYFLLSFFLFSFLPSFSCFITITFFGFVCVYDSSTKKNSFSTFLSFSLSSFSSFSIHQLYHFSTMVTSTIIHSSLYRLPVLLSQSLHTYHFAKQNSTSSKYVRNQSSIGTSSEESKHTRYHVLHVSAITSHHITSTYHYSSQ